MVMVKSINKLKGKASEIILFTLLFVYFSICILYSTITRTPSGRFRVTVFLLSFTLTKQLCLQTVEKARKKIKKVSERVGESVDDLDETALEGDLAEKQSITGEVEKSGDDDLSADLLQLMVPVAIEK